MHPSHDIDARAVVGNWAYLGLSIGVSVPWSACALADLHPGDLVTAILAGLSILGAAFLLSWAVETAEMDVPPTLAVSLLALVAVLPEYAVDATFAWKAATDPAQAHYAVANMTGGNRLLLGVGWSLLVFIAWGRFGKPGIRLPTATRLDVGVLFMASMYALVPVARGRITLFDTCVLVSMYVVYVIGASRVAGGADDEDGELVGPSALLGSFGAAVRRPLLVGILLWAAGVIFLAAEPFAESLVHTGLRFGVDEFLLVQWVAPLASEAPELAVAALLVIRGRLAKGMLTLVSSKVNQWTLLIGTLPVVTSLAASEPRFLALDERQSEEVFLTAAQSVFGVAVLGNLLLGRLEAIVLIGLFALQMAIPSTEGRFFFAVAYLVAAGIIVVVHRESRSGLLGALGGVVRALRGRTP